MQGCAGRLEGGYPTHRPVHGTGEQQMQTFSRALPVAAVALAYRRDGSADGVKALHLLLVRHLALSEILAKGALRPRRVSIRL
jgi:hypothetical protein